MVPPEDPIAKVGPKLRGQIHEAVIGDVNDEMREDSAARAARCRIVEVGKPAAHRAAQDVIEIEGISAGVLAKDESAAHGISEAVLEGAPRTFAMVPGILMKSGGHDEISEKILRENISDRSAIAFTECCAPLALPRISLGHLRKDGVEGAGSRSDRRHGFVHEIAPLRSCGTNVIGLRERIELD